LLPFAAITDDDALGVAAYRTKLETLPTGRPGDKRPHDAIIRDLDEAGQPFRVLVLKTDMTVPYTSVFLRPECGDWSPGGRRGDGSRSSAAVVHSDDRDFGRFAGLR
jgi:hypothetical protein